MNNTAIEELKILIDKSTNQLGLGQCEYGVAPEFSTEMSAIISNCILLKGENLKWLSGLLINQKETIDFCYIDPPYNTGQNFIYPDNKTEKINTHWGRHHTWMTFMLPRLCAAKLLLADSGVIAISIDDYEYAYLKILMDTIFDSTNYMATLIVTRSKNGKGSKLNVAVNHEYVLLYGKTPASTIHGLNEDESAIYNKSDEFGTYKIDGLFRKKGDASLREDRPNMYYPLYYSKNGRVSTEKSEEMNSVSFPVDSKGVERRWLWGSAKAASEAWKLFASKNGVVYVKNYKSDGKKIKLRSVLDDPNYLTDKATREIKAIFGKKVFETPKPVSLIRDLIDCCSKPGAIILDFFAGSGTTAVAAWELDVRDNGGRRVILIEQNLRISDNHIARSLGFEKISDITEFRLKAIHSNFPKYCFDSFIL